MATDMTLDQCRRFPWLGEIMNNEPPMRRMGDRTDLKVPIVYLLSDASAYHTSDDLLITGGIHAGRLMSIRAYIRQCLTLHSEKGLATILQKLLA